MRHVTTAVCLLILFPAIVLGQKSHTGKTALHFAVNSLSLKAYNGGIGIKRWLNEYRALIIGVIGERNSSSRETFPTNSDIDIPKTEANSKNFGVFSGIQFHSRINDSCTRYFSGEGKYIYGSSENGSINWDTYNQHSFNSTVSAGVEYWFSDRISAAAQYGIGFSYSSATKKPYSGYKETTTGTSFKTGIAELHLSIYF